jgi:hypothetical protein
MSKPNGWAEHAAPFGIIPWSWRNNWYKQYTVTSIRSLHLEKAFSRCIVGGAFCKGWDLAWFSTIYERRWIHHFSHPFLDCHKLKPTLVALVTLLVGRGQRFSCRSSFSAKCFSSHDLTLRISLQLARRLEATCSLMSKALSSLHLHVSHVHDEF